MKDYMPQYEEYKKSLLQSWHFMDGFKKKQYSANSFVQGAIGHFVPLWGLSPAVCGVCFVFCSVIAEDSTIWRIVFAIACLASFLLGVYALSKFKKRLADSLIGSFLYGGYVESHVRYDKQRESEKLLFEALTILSKMQEDPDNYELIKQYKNVEERYDQLYRYDSFERDLKTDYYFQKAMHEYI